MKNKFLLLLGLIGIFLTSAYAKDAVELDRQQCVLCHGPGGNTTSNQFPKLAGQPHEYFIAQMKAFREKSRADENAQRFMWGIASRLSDKEIVDLAAYYESQVSEHHKKVNDQNKYDLGKSIFTNGKLEKGVPACAACHGDKGQGLASVPEIGSQNETYIKRQLKVFFGNERPSAVAMHEIVKNLTSEDIEAIAEYLQAQ
jgi:cytochrome c553